MPLHKEQSSLGELFGELTGEVSTLVRQELALAQTEMSQKGSILGTNAAYIAGGGAVAYVGFMAVVAGVIIGLAAAGLQWWMSALIVGVVVLGVGYFILRKGLDGLKTSDLTPQRTIRSLREVGNGQHRG